MKLWNACIYLFALFAAPNSLLADEPVGAAALAKVVAPFVDDQTVAVAHVDVTRVDVAPLGAALARMLPDSKAEIAQYQSGVAASIARFTQAGGKDVYFVVSLNGSGLAPSALLVIPIAAGADEKEIRALLPFPVEAVRHLGDALVCRLPPNDRRSIEVNASPRPELATALAAAGDGPAQAVLIPPAYTQRVVEEIMPQLPKEVGGGPSSVLTRGIKWMAVGVDLPPHAALRATIKSQDAQAAEAFCSKWTDILRLAGQSNEVRTALPQFAALAALLTPKVEGDRIVLAVDSKSAGVGKFVETATMAMGSARLAASRTQSINNMKQIALAMHVSYDTMEHLPAPAICDANGKPLLSWRVYILPYISAKELYDQFHLNEPWDSEHNKKLIEKMPAMYHAAASKTGNGKTNYLLPVGNGALYASNSDAPKFQDVTDGTSHTIMVVEVGDDQAVTWTKPDDLAFDPKDPKKAIGSLYPGGFIAAFCDGSVHFLSASIDVKILTALFTRAGGEAIPNDFNSR